MHATGDQCTSRRRGSDFPATIEWNSGNISQYLPWILSTSRVMGSVTVIVEEVMSRSDWFIIGSLIHVAGLIRPGELQRFKSRGSKIGDWRLLLHCRSICKSLVIHYTGECLYDCSDTQAHCRHSMMTSSNGNTFRVTGHLCGEFTGSRWIPSTKASDAGLSCFLWSAPE